ncbi:FAD-dependent monooxygenase [Aurantiacibacter aquimixticola]|uniref:FAD-binding monooxygenase n=1 Tax=Aurantiacibacter aquimixticola TaxID=1958945 RepID=A0A419RRL4_9SPHN|nr:FAD-dependent monooxygenase [Aurantiacibacter aquimixticola]RJY08443.1 FAD-binding monooxygenase [Aurantiacibacter aquimixticola]
MTKKVLISGASISGPTTAYWLARNGFDVTVLERASELRLGGQNIDITDAARDIVELMGLRDAIADRHTGEKGLRFVDEDGEVQGSFPVDQEVTWTREVEILRGDLAKLIVDACPDSVDWRFGDHITALEEEGDKVRVEFAEGEAETFDIVVAADGMNSGTRDLIVGDDQTEDYLGCWASYFTIPRYERDNDWWNWYTSSNGIIVFLRPDNQGTIRASVNFLSDDSNPDHMSLEDKKRILKDKLRGSGWESDRVAHDLDGVDDIFLGPLHQVKADRWSSGRCVLTGDAAYCPTPYTGMGTTLAIIGSYILANELAAHDDHKAAFDKYERKFRDFAEKSQKLWPGVPDLAYAESEWKKYLINLGAGLAASAPMQKLVALFDGGDDENDFELPKYENRAARETA